MSDELKKIAEDIRASQKNMEATIKNYFSRDVKEEGFRGTGKGTTDPLLKSCPKVVSVTKLNGTSVPSGVFQLTLLNANIRVQEIIVSAQWNPTATAHGNAAYLECSNFPDFRDVVPLNAANFALAANQQIGNGGLSGSGCILPIKFMLTQTVVSNIVVLSAFLRLQVRHQNARLSISDGGNGINQAWASIIALGE